MLIQTAFSRETFITDRAFVRSLSCMDRHMQIQTAFSRETFITDRAFVRSLSCMDPHMIIQTAFSRETLITVRAFVPVLLHELSLLNIKKIHPLLLCNNCSMDRGACSVVLSSVCGASASSAVTIILYLFLPTRSHHFPFLCHLL